MKRKKNSADFLTITLDSYDYFGNAASAQDPDGTFTCRTWDSNRNYLSQIREAMAGQTNCSTTNSADLITSFVRDSALRLTKTTLPRGDCQHKDYDTSGRLTNTMVRDDCIVTNAGNTKTEYYDANGRPLKTEYLEASGTVKHRVGGAFTDGMQIAALENPVLPSYSRTFSYFADGATQLLTFENGIGKTEWVWDSQNRETTRKLYTDVSNSLNWSLNYPVNNATSSKIYEKVTDPASKNVFTYIDDLRRRTSHVSTGTSNTTTLQYDAASRLVTEIDADGSPQPFTHTFTYDNLGRKLTEDYGTETACPSNPIDVQYTYDALPAGVSCPAGASCTRLAGRLAHVKSFLLCVSGSSAIFQETFYGYDDNGRQISEYITDSTGRTAQQNYTWDKNGNLTDVKSPSGASMTNTYGSTGNSDANLITTLARSVSGSPTNLITGIQWAPFGPVTQYDQANTITGNSLRATLTWNLAYRATQIKFATTGVNKTTIDYTEDEKGRYTQKLYSNVHTGIQNDYLKYDWLDRPTCDAAVSGTCPTSGSNLSTNIDRYDSSNDRDTFYHQAAFFGDYLYDINYYTGTELIASIIQSGAAGTTAVNWDGRGDRWYEDNDNSTVDRRDYTYDGRSRVRNVIGKFLDPLGFFRDYRITYASDHRDRLVFQSFVNLSQGGESQTFYYYDLNDRLIEVRKVPDISSPSTYTIYNFYWLGERPVAMWATAFPAATTARYFMHADESNRILEVHDWPTSGDANLVWALNPDIFGWDIVVTGSIYQPFRLNNMLLAENTAALKGSIPFVINRPGLLIDRGGHYDPMTETFLQRIGEWPNESFAVGEHNPSASTPVIPAPMMFITEPSPQPTRCGSAEFSDEDFPITPPSNDSIMLMRPNGGGALPAACYSQCFPGGGVLGCSICSFDLCSGCGGVECSVDDILGRCFFGRRCTCKCPGCPVAFGAFIY